jgi:lysophospholipase L1-like esterase
MRSFVYFLALSLVSLVARAEDPLASAKRILFLGDSITHAGQYIDYFETHELTNHPERQLDVLGVGLPSETVSGLSEEGHAGGQFPRPGLHERLERVLAVTKPELIFACYGMNDGIYLGFSEERFAKYQEGIRRLREKAAAAGAKIIHLTPPVFDVEPVKERASQDPEKPQYVGYDEVLGRYAKWLLEQRAQGWTVIDIHGPMKEALAARRAEEPGFAFAKDGVHPNEEGHRVIATALLGGLGEKPDLDALSPELVKLVSQRRRLRGNAYLSAAGHQRPGMTAGLPLEEAEAKAAEITEQIAALLKR